MVEQHARLSPSAAYRWMECPGSIKLSEGVSKQSSAASREGSLAHYLAEQLLKGKTWDNWLTGASKETTALMNEFRPDEEMLENVMVYVDYCKEVSEDLSNTYFIEQKVSLETYHPDIWGTADFATYNPDTNIFHMVDLKYGAGHFVDAEENTQLMIYGLGAVEKIYRECPGHFEDIKDLTLSLTIVQPRIDHENGVIRSWEVQLSYLFWWLNSRLIPAAKATDEKIPKLYAGEHCRFCPACPCAVYQKQQEALINTELGVVPDIESFHPSPEQIGELLDFWGKIGDLKEKMNARVLAMALSGTPIPGYKLVKKRAHRQWTDQSKIESVLLPILGQDTFKSKVVTPAQAEKLVDKDQKKFLKNYIYTPDNGLTLAKLSDKRPAIIPPADAIDMLMEDDE